VGVDLLTAFALLLVLEGLLPFASPELLRRLMLQAAQASDRGLRASGLVSMLIGLFLLYLARH
jgi:uncharacterized protein YjeT (DUF2065 family)